MKKRQELGLAAEAFVILSVGELNINKNHETIIKALARLKIQDLYYVICGEGNHRKNIENLIEKYGLKSQVKLLGFRYDVNEIYNIVDVFVFPSFREGLPVSLMEAMVMGLPVVCSNIRGNNDLIKDGLGGYLVKPNDIEGFAQSIEKLYMSANNRKIFGENNEREVKKFYSEKVLEKLENIYLRYSGNSEI